MKQRSREFHTAEPDGVRLHAIEWISAGRAPTLVLLHGGGANAHWWDHLAPRFAERFRVVALDFRGHGDSEFPEAVVAGSFQTDLECLLSALRVEAGDRQIVLMGHSMGAHVALDHAAVHRDNAAVIAVDVARGGPKRTRRAMRLALAIRRTYRTAEEAVDRYRFMPATPAAAESLREHVARHSVRREADGRYGFKFDPRWFGLPATRKSDLRDVACPVLLLRGAESGLLSREGAGALVAELPDARVVDVPGAGHNLHLEQPDAVVEALFDFTRDVLRETP